MTVVLGLVFFVLSVVANVYAPGAQATKADIYMVAALVLFRLAANEGGAR